MARPSLPGSVIDKLQARGDVVIRNPTESYIARDLPNRIRRHHAFRALQLLRGFQQANRFTTDDFDVFVGPGVANAIGDDSTRKRPPSTSRRSLSTLLNVDDWLPFPGRIYFTSAQTTDLLAVTERFLREFHARAPTARASSLSKKRHPFSFRQSLAIFINGRRSADLTPLRSAAPVGSIVQIINIAPHAATLELRLGVMHAIVGELRKEFSPGVQVGYDFINSDQVGLTYGPGTGGPSPATARRTNRPSPTPYFLPMAIFFIPKAGRSNLPYRPLGYWKKKGRSGRVYFSRRTRRTIGR